MCVGGAFKTMPVSPKESKPVLSGDPMAMEPDAGARIQVKTENQTAPNIFTFNTVPSNSKQRFPISLLFFFFFGNY